MTFSALIALPLLLFASSSCEKELPLSDFYTIEIIGTSDSRTPDSSGDLSTKTVFGEPDLDNNYSVLWESSHKAAFSLQKGSLVSSTPSPSSDGKYASFSPSFKSEPFSGDEIHGFSPRGSYDNSNKVYVGGFTGVKGDKSGAWAVLPAEQTPLESSVDPTAQLLYGKTQYEQGKEIDISFSHAVAYGRMEITNFSGSKISSVEITFPQPVAGNSIFYDWGTNFSGADKNVLTLTPTNVKNNVFWFALLPFDGKTGEIIISVTDEKGDIYKKTIDLTKKALPFTTGKISKFKASFKGILPEGSTTTGIGWLELPRVSGAEDFVGKFYATGTSGAGPDRNYSYAYNYEMYSATWVAYPLCLTHTTKAITPKKSWKFNTEIDEAYQINIVGASYQSRYGNGSYSRGHQIPNADRMNNLEMNDQTYLSTNQTPQLQTNFNASIWSKLEGKVRELTTSDTDTVYVVTGPVYKTVKGNETINYITATSSSINPAKVPIPNYYWKVLLKVKRSLDGTLTGASAIGFWLEHKAYTSDESAAYDSFACSVDSIEEKTGIDFFVNLPDALETSAEANKSWTTFTNF